MKRLLLVMLSLLALTCFEASSVRAEESQIAITLFYQYTDSINASFAIDANGKATCSGTVVPSASSYTCSIRVRLQQKSGSVWNTIASWSSSGAGYAGASAGGTKNLTSSYTYRVYVSATVKDSLGNVIESPTKQSGWKTY